MASEAPVLSKYERVQLVAGRVEQLLAGAPKLVDDLDTDDVTAIAEEEIARRLLPVRIARTLPNKKKRVLDLCDFIDPGSAPTRMRPPAVQVHVEGREREREHRRERAPSPETVESADTAALTDRTA